MKNIFALLAGAAMILVALILAMNTSSQSQTPQPEVAQVFAAQLHMSPTPLPTQTPTATPTETLPPTATPIVGWVKAETAGIQLWLPPDFGWTGDEATGLGGTPDPVEIKQTLNEGETNGVVVLVANNWQSVQSVSVITSIHVIEMRSGVAIQAVPFEVGTNFTTVSGPQKVSLGRYRASRMVVDGPGPGGHVNKLLYQFTRGGLSWLVVYTVLANQFQAQLPLFEQSASSFSILQDY